MVEIEPVREDFLFLSSRDDILAILLYGSVAKGKDTLQSDIDI